MGGLFCHGPRGSRNEETRILTNEVFNETNGGETGTQVRTSTAWTHDINNNPQVTLGRTDLYRET